MMLLLLVRLLLLLLVLVVMMLTPSNTTVSSALEFALSPLAAASDEQYESIPNDKIALLARKLCALHKFYKERRSPRGCFKCGDTTHFIADCSKRKKLDSSNKMTTTMATRRRTASGIRRRSSRRSCPEHVLP
jgi:hypothetical protein